MKIDGNELAILQNELDQQGFKDEALKIKLELRIKFHPKSARFRQSQRLTSVSLFFLFLYLFG